MSDLKCKLNLKVVPGAKKDEVVGWHGDALKLRVRAAPEKGRANQAVIQLLAAALQCRPGQLSISSGHTSPRKVVSIEGLDLDGVKSRLIFNGVGVI